jgi:hypothetical protein
MKILNDPRGQWIFAQDQRDVKNEFPITTVSEEQIHHYVIDRTFIDKQDVRWIIDFKTAIPKGVGTERFLQDQQQLYQSQLTSYAEALRSIETRTICLGLYFPLFSGWCEWQYEK